MCKLNTLLGMQKKYFMAGFDAGWLILDTRYWILMLDTGRSLLDSYRIAGTGCRYGRLLVTKI